MHGLGTIFLNGADSSILTAVANDYSFDDIYSRQIEGLGAEGDVLIAISTSGNSKNVLRAVDKAKEKGLVAIGFTGVGGDTLCERSDLSFKAQVAETAHVQEVHITALHAIAETVEEIFFGS